MTIPHQLVSGSKTEFDLTEAADQHSLYTLTNTLLELPNLSLDELRNTARNGNAPLEFKISAKLAESKRFLLANQQPLKIGVVFAMWGEQHRLLPKSAENPNGEDSLRVKMEQLDWATQDSKVEWTLYAIDDGCPYHSGRIAADVAATHPLGQQVKVFYLADAIPTDQGP